MKKIFLTLLALTACSVTLLATVKGDVNGDGDVTSTDVTVLYNYLLNGDTSGIVNGDVNSDGYITSADVTYVYNILLGNSEFTHVYILGEVNGNFWSASNGVEMTTEDGKIYTAAITTEGDFSYNYFGFTTKLADPDSETPWNDIAPYRFGAVSAGDYNFIVTEELLGTEIALTTENYLALQMAHGSFNLRIDLENMKLTVTGEFAPQGITEYTVNGVKFKMVDVEGGTFTMGNPNYQSSDVTSNEGPAHQVTLSSYSIGQTEVTQELWQAVMGSNPSYYSGANLPVEQVSWNQCQAFVAKLNEMLPIEGYEWRLPTEAQWEFAARGGNKSQGYLYSGSNNIGDVAWYQNNGNYKTHQVATKAPNELDIYDMSGNVEEWCQDHYDDYSSSPQIDPCVSTGINYFLSNLRGGFYSADASLCRNTRRDCWDPAQSSMEIGLRLALCSVEGSNESHEYVDLGLPSGTLWATMNIGASSPEDYGDYFAWGETAPKDYYDWSTYQWCNGSKNTLTKYCNSSSYGYNGFTDGKTELDSEDDAATANWGPEWRMPSKAQQDELRENCTSQWTTVNGVNGCLFTSNINGASLFLPAVGCRSEDSLDSSGSCGYYWSRTLYRIYPGGAYDLFYVSSNVYLITDHRYYGFAVRAVRVAQN